jgi:hypothetical protein
LCRLSFFKQLQLQNNLSDYYESRNSKDAMFANCIHSMKKSITGFLIIIIIFQILVQTFTSCANIIPPVGGPRDTLPPVLVLAVPADSSLNFKTNKITLTFNEYIQLDNSLLQTNLVVSPTPNFDPVILGHLKDVTIRLKDTLKPNTTYSINFGSTIKDVNEGNPYRNFIYVFSTGNAIANGHLSGKVQLAQTGTADSTLIVLLYKNLNDSAVKKLKPDYFTRMDSNGKFNFRFIENGTYNIFVLPNDYSKKYDDSTKMFAFLNHPVTISDVDAGPLTLYAYNECQPGKEGGVNTSTNTQGRKKKDTTTTIALHTNLANGEQDLLGNLILGFAKPLEHFDSSKINLTDTNYHPITNYKITPDTSNENFTLYYPWTEDQYFKLIIQKDAFVDSSGKMLAKIDTVTFHTSKESAYGSIRLRFANLALNHNPVLQFLQNDKVVDSAALTGTEYYRRLYKPGDYQLRILYDEDKNMTWTPGSYELKKQPEIAIRIPRKITIKSNWDNEVNINL